MHWARILGFDLRSERRLTKWFNLFVSIKIGQYSNTENLSPCKYWWYFVMLFFLHMIFERTIDRSLSSQIKLPMFEIIFEENCSCFESWEFRSCSTTNNFDWIFANFCRYDFSLVLFVGLLDIILNWENYRLEIFTGLCSQWKKQSMNLWIMHLYLIYSFSCIIYRMGHINHYFNSKHFIIFLGLRSIAFLCDGYFTGKKNWMVSQRDFLT